MAVSRILVLLTISLALINLSGCYNYRTARAGKDTVEKTAEQKAREKIVQQVAEEVVAEVRK